VWPCDSLSVLWQASHNFSPNVFHIRALKEHSNLCLDQQTRDKPHSTSRHLLVYYINLKFQPVSIRLGAKHYVLQEYTDTVCAYPKSANGKGNTSAFSVMVVIPYRRFGIAYKFHLQGSWPQPSSGIHKMAAVCSLNTVGAVKPIERSTWNKFECARKLHEKWKMPNFRVCFLDI